MRTFEIINRSLRRNGRTYAVGSPIRLDEDNAAVLLQCDRIKLKAPEKAPMRTASTRAPRKTAVKK